MPYLGAALLVASLSLAVHYSAPNDSNAISLVAATNPTVGLPSSSFGSGATLPSASSIVSPDIANKECPEPQSRGGIQEVYRADKPQNTTYVENNRIYRNLYGKKCEGPLVISSCVAPNDCNEKAAGAKCRINGAWQDCKTPDNIREASVRTVQSDASPIGSAASQLGQQPAQTPSVGSMPGSHITNEALGTNAQGSPADIRAAVAASRSAPNSIDRLENFSGQGTAPAVSNVPTPGQQSQRFGLNPGLSQSIAPGSPLNTGPVPTLPTGVPRPAFPTGPIAAPSPSPTLQNTFRPGATPNPVLQPGSISNPRPQLPQQPQPPSASRPSFFRSTIDRTFGSQSLFGSLVSSIARVADAVVIRQPPAHDTIVQTTRPVSPPVIVVVQTPQLQQPTQQLVFVPTLSENYVINATSSTRFSTFPLGEGETRTVGSLVRTDVLQQLAREFADGAPMPTPISGNSVSSTHVQTGAPGVSQSNVGALLPEDAAAPDVAKQTFALTPTSTPIHTADFRIATSDRRTVSIVENFFAVPIPELLEVIGQGSIDAIRKFFARIQPDKKVVETRRPAERVLPLPTAANPSFGDASADVPGTSAPTRPVATDPSAGERIVSQPPVPSPHVFDNVVRQGPAWVFERTPTVPRVARVDGAKVYPNVIPVPEPREDRPSGPSFLELVVTNGAKELKNLFSFLWNIILPERDSS